MRELAVPFLSIVALAFAAAPAWAGDPEAGKSKAVLCMGCHGPAGEGRADEQLPVPAIAGQIEGYLIRSMEGYKSGERKDAAMNAMFQNIGSEDIRDLAAYYASMK